ncbi:hypothetical protein RhiJN_19958 [Ceratobasidium sp. AG-Ba]|nr:hypothetical protein RhiJN_19958 [Ceratobasidium sp. AG-Ba]
MPGPTRTNQTSVGSTQAEDSLAKLGRRIVRMHEMWPGNDLINLGKELQAMSDDALLGFRERSSSNPQKVRMIELVEKLTEWEPTLFERLNRPSHHAAAAAREAKSRLNIGFSNGRSEDARKARELMGKWGHFEPPLGDKSERGLKHRQCAELLASPTFDWTNEEAVNNFMGFGIPAPNASIWPALLWATNQFDRQNIHKGLLENEYLFCAANAILFSPSSSLPPTVLQASSARGRNRRGPIGIAKSNQLTEVTPGLIAYVACITRHALTSDEIFSERCSGFSYVEFYKQITSFLQDPRFAHWSHGLMARWNEKLFSGMEFGYTHSMSTPVVGGTLDMLTAQLEAETVTQEQIGLGGNGSELTE